MKIFISSVQDEFAEERRKLKNWLCSDPFVSRFVDSVFLFEDMPSRDKSPVDVYLDEVRASDIYIGLIGTQYYGRTSVRRGVSATEREYDAAGRANCERWVYLKAVDRRDSKTDAFVKRVNRDVMRTMFCTFEDLKVAVYASVVEFLDRRELIAVGDFDKSVCAEMTAVDISAERVKWYLAEMSVRKKKAALPLTTSPVELLKHLGLMKGEAYTWAAALCFAENPQRWSYRTTLKCVWCEGTEYTRPFLDTDKFEGNLFALLEQGTDFVMSRIAQSRGLRTEGPRVPVKFEIPREAVEEALINALVHRNWKLSASVELRLFADRLEVWTPGALPEGITIPQLYETHASYPVNELVLKTFDFAGIIESLGTGIQRMIDACRASELPDPTWEQRGHSLIATIWKDTWTPMRLREAGVSERQMLAIPTLKRNRQITVAEYMSLTGVRRNTATADLAKLEKSGVVVRQGVGRGVTYAFCEMHNKCTRCTTDILRNKSQMRKTVRKTGGSASSQHANADVNTTQKGSQESSQESSQEGSQEIRLAKVSEGARRIYGMISTDGSLKIKDMAAEIGVSTRMVMKYLKELEPLGVRHVGSTKKGRWVIGT